MNALSCAIVTHGISPGWALFAWSCALQELPVSSRKLYPKVVGRMWERGKSLYISQYGVTKMIECEPTASAVDGERFHMLIMILHSNFRSVSGLEMSIMNTNIFVFRTSCYLCCNFIFLCHLDTPKINGVTAMFVSMSPGDLLILPFGAPPRKKINHEIFPKYVYHLKMIMMCVFIEKWSAFNMIRGHSSGEHEYNYEELFKVRLWRHVWRHHHRNGNLI